MRAELADSLRFWLGLSTGFCTIIAMDGRRRVDRDPPLALTGQIAEPWLTDTSAHMR
jgi:hypothetical protein